MYNRTRINAAGRFMLLMLAFACGAVIVYSLRTLTAPLRYVLTPAAAGQVSLLQAYFSDTGMVRAEAMLRAASGIAPETAVAVNMPVTKIFAKKGNKPASKAASSPVVQQIMQAALTPEEKEVASQKKITEGKKVEETGDYVGAYRLYKQAADMGNDKGRLNCAILLVQNNVTYTNNLGADISLEVARQFAEETVKKTKSKEFKAIAYNILGIIFNSGGQGVRRNVPLAIKYFEQGAALGDKNAKKNLEGLRKLQ
jgi:hypothetical protein